MALFPQSVIDRADSVVIHPSKAAMNLAETSTWVLYDRLSKIAPNGTMRIIITLAAIPIIALVFSE